MKKVFIKKYDDFITDFAQGSCKSGEKAEWTHRAISAGPKDEKRYSGSAARRRQNYGQPRAGPTQAQFSGDFHQTRRVAFPARSSRRTGDSELPAR